MLLAGSADAHAQPARHAGEGSLRLCKLGSIGYAQALALQLLLRAQRQDGAIADTLLLLEHPPTFTRGRRTAEAELPGTESFYRERGIELHSTDRGGRATYHGPGQLVGYLVMAVDDVIGHLRMIEATLITALEVLGIRARSRASEGADFTGVWVENRKIASIGVHVCGGVSTHGFALNVTNDLAPFGWIVPCGLSGVRMTSVRGELGGRSEGLTPRLCEQATAVVAGAFCAQLQREELWIEPSALASAAPGRPQRHLAGGVLQRAGSRAVATA